MTNKVFVWVANRFFSKYIEPKVVEVKVDTRAIEKERILRKFAERSTKKYGITYEDLISDFNPGKFLGGAEIVFWNEYLKKGPFSYPWLAREKANAYSVISRQELDKLRSDIQARVKTFKQLIDVTFKKAIDDFFVEGTK
jgi:hypothetical protein